MFQVGPLVAGQGTQPILLRTRPNQTPEWFGANPIPYSRAVALPKARPTPSYPLAVSADCLSSSVTLFATSICLVATPTFRKVALVESLNEFTAASDNRKPAGALALTPAAVRRLVGLAAGKVLNSSSFARWYEARSAK